MGAARPGRTVTRGLVGLLVLAISWTPWALVWGDDLHRVLDFDQAADDGQALGSTLGTDPDRLAPFEQPDDYRVYFPGAET
ncbi:hypothetical protein CKO29_17090, partial [Allochromatium vinosum]|nr:hypothetical protein [Allochromatium vinosum]